MVVAPKIAEIMGFQSELYFVGFHFFTFIYYWSKSTWVSFALLIFFDKTCLVSLIIVWYFLNLFITY